MGNKRKAREKSPNRAVRKPGARPPAEVKFAPIIEELGRMKTRLETDPSYLSNRPLSLQERTQMEIEGVLLRKEKDVRLDFGEAFRQNPQALVEMVSAMRKYGDADILRNLVFAAETLYGDKLRELPGGMEFWEDLKREVAPLPHPPALTPSDLRLQRLQAIEIFREAIVTYDILSEGGGAGKAKPAGPPGPAGAAIPEGAAGVPADGGSSPSPAALPEPPARTPVEAAPPPAPEPPSPSPALARPAPALPSQENGVVTETRGGPGPDAEALRLDHQSRQLKESEKALRSRGDELLLREQRLLALEHALEEKEKRLLASEEEKQNLLDGHRKEREQSRKREQELARELEETCALKLGTEGELARLRTEAAQTSASYSDIAAREEALCLETAKAREERAALEKLRGELRTEEERQRKLGWELDRKSTLSADVEAREARLREASSSLDKLREQMRRTGERLAASEADISARLEQADRELAEKKSELTAREAALGDLEKRAEAQDKRIVEERIPTEEKPAAGQRPAPAGPRPVPETARPAPPAGAVSAEEQVPASTEVSILSRLAILAASPRPAEAVPPETPAPPTAETHPEGPAAGGGPPPVRAPEPSDGEPGGESAPPSPEAEGPKALYKVKCPGCKNVIPVYTKERPLKIRCPSCGKEGVLK